MSSINELLQETYVDLQSKMYKCKTIHVRYEIAKDHKEFLIRQAVLSIYSAWEGFLKSSISIYLQELNKKELTYSDLDDSYLAYQMDKLIDFKSPKTSFKVMREKSTEIYSMLNDKVVFNTKVNTESNANLKVSNSILEKLKLNKLKPEHNDKLNKLLLFRNSVAHGDDGIRITQSDLDSFTLLVQDMSAEVIESILQGFNSELYLAVRA